jgi:methionine sulfoxide reductase heme-binding subunit
VNPAYPELAQKKSIELRQMLKSVFLLLLTSGLFVALLLILWFLNSPLGAASAHTLTSLFAMDSVQAWWYITRAAGLTGYFLLWLSMAWGLALATKMLHPVVENTFTYDFHEFLSLLGLGFILLHVIVLLFDQYLSFNILQLLIPFIDSYRPLWVGLGVIGMYLFLLVTMTFYLRQRIGNDAFRAIHVVSLLGYLSATLHGLFAGTDSGLPVTRILYGGSFLVILFLTVYWFVMKRLSQPNPAPAKNVPAKRAFTYAGSYQKIKPWNTPHRDSHRRR